jgi:hypothetical protein
VESVSFNAPLTPGILTGPTITSCLIGTEDFSATAPAKTFSLNAAGPLKGSESDVKLDEALPVIV